ncbi:hypothetical protein L1887_34728 [Cichorium endivia]|nr:hypothetical protein L1887_34728 [Cichorium endivia]
MSTSTHLVGLEIGILETPSWESTSSGPTQTNTLNNKTKKSNFWSLTFSSINYLYPSSVHHSNTCRNQFHIYTFKT